MNARLLPVHITALVNQLDYYGIISVPTYAERDAILAQRSSAVCLDTGVTLSITQPDPQYRWVRPAATCGICKQRYEVPQDCMERMRAEWLRFNAPVSDEVIVRELQPNLCCSCARSGQATHA